jgi:heptose I phosphotransferase
MKHGLRVNPTYVPQLQQYGLDTLERVMAYSSGEVMREAHGRITVKLAFGGDQELYLKRHFPPNLRAASEGIKEWDNIETLRSLGISCPQTVAAGGGVVNGVRCGFLITVAVPGAVPLDDYLASLYRVTGDSLPYTFKRRLIGKLADLAKRLHGPGYHHKDFYLCHVFVNQYTPLDSPLVIIDLQRLSRAHWFRRRWVIKDLAALNYSARDEFTTHADRLRFLLAYLGMERLDPRARRLLRAVLRKTERIRRHDLKQQSAARSQKA